MKTRLRHSSHRWIQQTITADREYASEAFVAPGLIDSKRARAASCQILESAELLPYEGRSENALKDRFFNTSNDAARFKVGPFAIDTAGIVIVRGATFSTLTGWIWALSRFASDDLNLMTVLPKQGQSR